MAIDRKRARKLPTISVRATLGQGPLDTFVYDATVAKMIPGVWYVWYEGSKQRSNYAFRIRGCLTITRQGIENGVMVSRTYVQKPVA